MFGITNDVTSNTARFPIGEQVPNVYLKKCEYTEGEYGPQIAFTYECHTDDGIATLIDWRGFPQQGEVEPRNGETVAEAFDRAVVEFNDVIRHISTKVMTEEQVAAFPVTDTPQKFVETLSAFITDATKDNGPVAMWAKTSQNNKGYARLSRYPSFLQRMDAGPCTLKYSKWESENLGKANPVTGITEMVKPDITELI